MLGSREGGREGRREGGRKKGKGDRRGRGGGGGRGRGDEGGGVLRGRGGTEEGKGRKGKRREDTNLLLFSLCFPPFSASPSIIASVKVSGRTSNGLHASLSGSGFPKALAIQKIYRVFGGS